MEKYKRKRLTKYNEYNHNAEVYSATVGKEDIYFDGVDIVDYKKSNLAQETIDKLAELEDKIENGTIKEVIRCKDCKCLEELHYEEVGEKPYIKNVCRLFKRTMQLNDFCSYALPKEQQNEQQRKAD